MQCCNKPVLKYFIDNQASSLTDSAKRDIMALALTFFNRSVIAYLIVMAKFDISVNDTANTTTILHKARELKNIIQLKFLVEQCGCSPHITNENGDTLIDSFCKSLVNSKTDFEILYYLFIKHNCCPKLSNYAAVTVLMIAVSNREKGLTLLHHLVDNCGCRDVVQGCSDSVFVASIHWYDEMIKYLIVELHCDTFNHDMGYTLLHRVCRSKNPVQLKFLIEKCHCSPYIKNSYGETLLDVLCKNLCNKSNDFEILYCLCVDYNICSILPNNAGVAAVKLCVANGDKGLTVIRHIIEKCVGDLSSNSACIVSTAYSNWHCEIMRYLIVDSKYDTTVDEKTSNTVLHEAIVSEDGDRLKFLLDKCHCDPQVVNKNGETILHLFCSNYRADFEIFYSICIDYKCVAVLPKHMGIAAIKYAISYQPKGIAVVRHLIENCHCDIRDDTMDILFLACSNQNNAVVKYLIVELGCDISDCETGDSILHKVCESKKNSALKCLLKECNCNPGVINSNGHTILHTLCESSQFGQDHFEILRFLCTEYSCYESQNMRDNNGSTVFHLLCDLISLPDYSPTCIDAFYFLLKNCECDLNITNKYAGSTILHQLCSKVEYDFHVNKLVTFVIKEGKSNPSIKDGFGDSVLHIIIQTRMQHSPEELSLIYYLINEEKCDITSKNRDGNTPLHLACKYFNGDTTIIEYILSSQKADPLAINCNGETPVMILHQSNCDKVEDEKRIRQLFTRFGNVKVFHSINSYVNVVLLGDPGAGKSTLAKVINDRNKYIIGNQFRNVKEVELHTAGIIPNIMNDKNLGRVVLHDLAGQTEYYSSHTAVLENLLQGSAAVFVIVVSLADDNFLKSFHLWFTIVENVSHNAFYRCQLIVVASHIDQLIGSKVRCVDQIKQEVSKRLQLTDVLSGHGVLTLDCRKLGGSPLTDLITTISTACQLISNSYTREMSLYCHMLYDFFKRAKQSMYKLGNLVERKKQDDGVFLPSQIDQIAAIVSNLNSTGLIVFLTNPNAGL